MHPTEAALVPSPSSGHQPVPCLAAAPFPPPRPCSPDVAGLGLVHDEQVAVHFVDELGCDPAQRHPQLVGSHKVVVLPSMQGQYEKRTSNLRVKDWRHRGKSCPQPRHPQPPIAAPQVPDSPPPSTCSAPFAPAPSSAPPGTHLSFLPPSASFLPSAWSPHLPILSPLQPHSLLPPPPLHSLAPALQSQPCRESWAAESRQDRRTAPRLMCGRKPPLGAQGGELPAQWDKPGGGSLVPGHRESITGWSTGQHPPH